MLSEEVKAKIESCIQDNRVMLFMKGEKTEPMCGFSAQVVQILNQAGVEYHTENVLADWDLREGIKEFSNWPTIPQLYVNGKFLGGCDIVMELHRKGELSAMLP
ncbi:MAG: Grx4 family monothiol glutaredoxin [Zetaproteobacteria bacterium]|nr:Grx4 family monothiol glutaredoxin [Zetaproteobacteria bacterium]